MIIRRAFYRETLRSGLAIVAVLLIILIVFSMTGLLARAVRGDYPSQVVPPLLGWQTLKYLDLLLPLGLYLSILLTLSRWYRDSEMTVLAACGVGLPWLLRPLLVLTLIVALVVALLGFYFTPMASRQIQIVKDVATRRPDISTISPGTFTESRTAHGVVYAERINDETGVLENVFATRTEPDGGGVVRARSGVPYVDADTGDRFLALRDGVAYEGTAGEADFRIVEFETFNLRFDPRPPTEPPPAIGALRSRELWRTAGPDFRAEWHWRLAKPVGVVVLALFALVLAHTDTRRGRTANLFAALLVYFIYSNLLGLGQTLIRKDQVLPGLGLWWVHVPLALIAVYLFHRRSQNRPLLPAWRGRTSR